MQKGAEMSKTAIVTGGSRGIGRAVCIRLAKDGYNIVFNYNSNEEQANITLEEIEKQGVQARAFRLNIKESENCAELVKQTADTFGTVDVLVNNAGITRDGLLMRMKDEDFADVIDTNLSGAFYMLRAVSKYMMQQRHGSIINMSSIVGVNGNAGQVNYAASKAGIIGMTKSAARELAARNIRVNAVAPGMIETDMTAVLPENVREQMLAQIPLKEIGKPEDIANTVAFFASEDSRYITGQVLLVDGGMS